MSIADVIRLIRTVDRLIDLEQRVERLGPAPVRSDRTAASLSDAERLVAIEQIIIPFELGQVTRELSRLMDALKTAGKEVKP